MKNYFGEKIGFRTRFDALKWAIQLAWKFGKGTLVLWIIVNISLAILPAVALYFHKEILAQLSSFLSNGMGNYDQVASLIILYGILFTFIGLSSRFNEDFIYMAMYDRYYFGMEGMMMEAIQRMPMKFLRKKEIRDEHNAVVNREGSLTDFISGFCVLLGKLSSIVSLLILAYTMSKLAFLFHLFIFALQ